MTMKTAPSAPRPRFLSTSTRIATMAFALMSALGVTLSGPHAAHRARLSADLTVHLARATTARTRVIVSGTDQDVDAIALRHHLLVAHRLASGGVRAAISSGIG